MLCFPCMEFIGNTALEELNRALDNDEQLVEYKKPFDGYKPLFLPRVFGNLLVACGNIVYGNAPSYLKFRAVEVIARVPYHSWEHAAFTLLTLFYADESQAIRLSRKSGYARIAQDNETMHVIVVSQLAEAHERAGFIRHTLIPVVFASFYFGASYLLYLIRPRWSLELNYLFESHAFEQYDTFITTRSEELKNTPIMSEYLSLYGRNPISQYEFFKSVRNDELIHRNQSIHDIDSEEDATGRWKPRAVFVLLAVFAILLGIDTLV